MNGQKTAAKWLVIILLVSISIFSYAMYDSFFVSDSGSVQGDDTTQKNTDAQPITQPDNDKEPQKVVYTEFPRPALFLGNTTIQHTGGHGEEELLATHNIGTTTIIVLKTASNSFDYKAENHLALALFDDKELKRTLVFSAKNENFLDSKITSNGIVVLTKTANGVCKLRQFSTAILLTGETTLDFGEMSLSFARLYFDNTSLLLFGLSNSQLICKSVSSTLSVSNVCAPYNILDCTDIVSIQKVNDNFVLALNSSFGKESAISILTMNAINGFTLEKTINAQTAISLGIALEESIPYFILTSKTQTAVHLQKLSITFNTLYSTTLDGATSAVVSQSKNSYIVVTPKAVYYLCRHLDCFYTQELKPDEVSDFDLVKSILYFGGKHYSLLYSTTTHRSAVIQVSDFSISLLYSFGAENSEICLHISTTALRVFFTTALKDGIFASNFGGKDVFFVAIDTSAK